MPEELNLSQMIVNSTKDQIEEFKESILWTDIKRELLAWKRGFAEEMSTIVDEAAMENPSTAAVLLHMGDLNGRQKAVDYILALPDVFLSILEDKDNGTERDPAN